MTRAPRTQPVEPLRFTRHPLQGKAVRSRSTGATGVLVSQMVSPGEYGGMIAQVFVRPLGGGQEWTTSPTDVEPV